MDYFEPKDFVPVRFPNLKPSSRSISIRIPTYIIDRVKEQANGLDIPYQSLMKQYLAHGAYPARGKKYTIKQQARRHKIRAQ